MSQAHEDSAPGLPAVRDEAAETPWWVPLLGLVLALVVVAFIVWRARSSGDEPAQDPGAGVAAQGASTASEP